MEFKTSRPEKGTAPDINGVAAMIINAQRSTGEIPWCDGDKTDPWDLVEAIMGLTIGGYYKEARLSFDWMKRMQLEDGSWYASYKNGVPEDETRDTNMSSYIAVGLFHYYLITGDKAFAESMWNTVCRGLDFALSLQAPGGEIYWAKSPEGVVDPMALLTGSSSVYMSLKCGLSLAKILGTDKPEWRTALHRLGDSINNRRHIFNVAKSRFSMDWFYPVLSGAMTGHSAEKRIEKYWKKFVVEGMGIRCVSDQPWVTVAETSEFVLALSAMGDDEKARIFYNWILDRKYDDGSYWCGFTFPDMVIWPEDKLTWTNAVVMMAADALYGLTPAGSMFRHEFWRSSEFADVL